VLLGALLALYCYMQLLYFAPVTGGTDQNGYHVCARMFNLNGVFYQKPGDDLEFIGHMWVVNDRGEYYPKYPVLYPLLAAGMNELLGMGGGFYATLWGAVLAIAGMYVLARFFMGSWYSLLAAFLLASSPIVFALGITKNSHTPSLALLIWGMAAFLYAARHPVNRNLMFAALGGFLIAYTVGVRYTDFLLILIPLSYIAFVVRDHKLKWKLLIFLALGTAIPYGAMACFHTYAYGAPWRTGYSLTDESSAFHLKFVWENLGIYIPEFFVLAVGPLAFAAFLNPKIRWRMWIFWVAWIVPTFCLYLTYYWAPDGEGTGAMRFLVPVIPPVLLLACLGIRNMFDALDKRKIVFFLIAVFVVIQGVWGYSRMIRLCESKYASDLQNLFVIETLNRRIPAGSVVFAGTNLCNELGFEQRWRLYPTYVFTPNEIKNVVERSLGPQAAGLQKCRAQSLKDQLGGLDYGKLYEFWRKFADKELAAGHDIYLVGSGEANVFRRIFNRDYEVEKIATLAGERPAYVLNDPKRDASRYKGKKKNVKMPVMEILRVSKKRVKPITPAESIDDLQQERRELINKLNPTQDPELSTYLNRLESIKDEINQLRNSLKKR